MLGRFGATLSAITVGACSVIGIRTTEEPPYRVIGEVGAVEIREYQPRLAAEVVVAGDELAARSDGFTKLARYIFGANHRAAAIAMTAPVAQSADPSTIAMTAPVAQDRAADGRWRVRFFMPAGETLATLPAPNDSDVALVEVPPERMAVLRFTGSTAADVVAARSRDLTATLSAGPWRQSGAVVAWFYDPPWTLPFLRRNEVAAPVAPR